MVEVLHQEQIPEENGKSKNQLHFVTIIHLHLEQKYSLEITLLLLTCSVCSLLIKFGICLPQKQTDMQLQICPDNRTTACPALEQHLSF